MYKVKNTVNGSIEKHMVIFVVKGYSHVEGINYEEKFLM